MVSGRTRPHVRIFCNPQGGVLGNLEMRVFLVYRFVPKGSSPWGRATEGQSRGQSCSHCVCVCVCRHQLETPGHYSHLAAFYEDKKGVLHAGPGRGGSLPPVYWLPSIHRYMYPEMKVRLARRSRGPGLVSATVVVDYFFDS